jgi:protein phosphatase 1 regulatory subunit 7
MIELEKFHVVDSLDGHKTITIRSDFIDECMEYYNHHEDIDGVYICPILGYKLQDISFLQQHKYVKGVNISDADRIDLSGIENLKELEYISLSYSTQPIDYSVFPKLKQIRSTWHPKVILSESINLKHLCFRHYKPQSKNLTELPNLPNLEFLGMVQSPIESTEGIGKFTKLTKINFAYLPKMTKLCDMESLPIETAEFQNCKKIQNLEYIGTVKTLKRLICDKCGRFQSIRFIEDLKRLEHFAFLDIDVLDGDMSPCVSVPYTAFTDKKKFSHTMKQIGRLRADRQRNKGTQ